MANTFKRLTFVFIGSSLVAGCSSQVRPSARAAAEPVVTELRSTEFRVIPPREGWQLGRVSWVATDRSGLIYLLQRGDSADPIVVVDRSGRVVRSWGRGLYELPHSIRLDRTGNVWTTDARTSDIRKFSADGKLLMTIAGSPPPADCPRTFCGVSDVAIAPNGHVFAADGYWNARIIEYTAEGRKVREWGSKGAGVGEFDLPHSIVIDDRGVIYVADRQNNRIQRFTQDGRLVDSWPVNGRAFSLELSGNTLWIGIAQSAASGALQPTLAKADAATGRVFWQFPVAGGHGIAVLPGGDGLLIDVVRAVHIVWLNPTAAPPPR